ncbi:hypothetical protein KF728_19285 [Candidatus Obscuribacterales bacterium]|nr:hypothetical protein [Candidatus Obscuribacterales bacterium]
MTEETTTSQTDTIPQKPKLLPLPDVGDLLFIGIMHVLLFGRPDFMFQDASVGWHLTAGKWIFENRAIPTTDLFSYTFPEKAWVAYEWLFDLIAYLLTMAGGLNLLAIGVATTIAFVLVKMYDRARADGGPLGLTTTVSIFGILASAIHWLARPHIVTLLCVFFYLKKLEDYYRGTISSTRLWLYLGLLMLLWVNCHPAFPLGIVLIGIYFLSALVNWFRAEIAQKAANFVRVKTFFIGGAIASLTTLINPYGVKLHGYILEYLKGSTILANTDEFRSPVFHLDDIHSICFEILIAFLFAGLAIGKKRPSLPYFAVTLFVMHMALSAVRSIPLFAIVSVPAIGLLFAKTRLQDTNLPLSEVFPVLKKPIDQFARPFREFAAQEQFCKMRILPICYVSFLSVVALIGGGFGDTKLLKSGFSTVDMPTTTLEYIKTAKLPYDKGFNYDNWGGLLRYKLDQRVYIDDRADFFGEEFYNRYGSIVQLRPGWQKRLDDIKVEWILVPKRVGFDPYAFAEALKREALWEVVAEDEGSYLFKKRMTGAPKDAEDLKTPASTIDETTDGKKN